MTFLQEIKAGDVIRVAEIPRLDNPGTLYTLKSGRTILVSAYGGVWLGDFMTTWFYGWRVKRALKRIIK